MKEMHLKNGLNIIINPMPNTHSVTLGLYVRAGARYEKADECGITHMLEHIHFRELCSMSQDELYYKMESIGSTLRAATYYDFLKYTMKIRPAHLPECIEIYKQLLSAYSWSDSSLTAEKKVVKKQIEERDFATTQTAAVRQNLFGNSTLSCGIMGSTETVEAITATDLAAYKKRVFNAENLILCVTGNINEDDISLLKSELEEVEMPNGERQQAPPCTTLHNRKPNITLISDGYSCMDVNISFDVDYGAVDIDELKILNCILGEGVGSRLQRRLREKLNFTTDIYSEIEAYEDFAVLHIKFSVQKKQLSECLKNIFDILAAMKHDISADDLAVSLPFYSENQEFLLDDTEQMNFELAYNFFILGREFKPVSMKNNSETIERLTLAAEKLFTPKNASIVVFGNTNRVTKKSIRDIVSALNK